MLLLPRDWCDNDDLCGLELMRRWAAVYELGSFTVRRAMSPLFLGFNYIELITSL